MSTVGFIGGGNMTRAIAGGLVEHGFPAGHISISEPLLPQRKVLETELPGAFVSDDNAAVVARSATLVLSVKPQILAGVCRQLAAAVQEQRPLVVSIAAGPRIEDIDSWLGGGNAVVRVMPNQPALLRQGVSGIFGNTATSDEQMREAIRILSAVGPVLRVPREEDIDAVTAVSGSGPAYFFLLIDMIANAGVELGLDPEVANTLATETAAGAAQLARSSDESMEELIARVRSPGGTTAAALDNLENHNVRDIFETALTAARDRATELADLAHESGKED